MLDVVKLAGLTAVVIARISFVFLAVRGTWAGTELTQPHPGTRVDEAGAGFFMPSWPADYVPKPLHLRRRVLGGNHWA